MFVFAEPPLQPREKLEAHSPWDSMSHQLRIKGTKCFHFPLRDYHEHLVSLGTGQLVITQHEKLFWFAYVDCGISLNFCFVQVGVTTTKSTLKHQLIDSHIDKAVIFLAQELEQKNLVLCPRLWLHSLTINHRSELNRSLENIWPNSHFTESPKGAQEEKWLAHSNMAIAY